MLAIVESRADPASSHICDHIRELVDWERCEDATRSDADGGGTYYRTDGAELRQFETRHLDLERPADVFACEPALLVFASKHAGGTGPLLTAHCTGNFGTAAFGGSAHTLAPACPHALETVLEAFDRYAPAGYETGLECTHHGPTAVGCPSLFAEVGSDEPQWNDPEGARAVAKAILELRGVPPHRPRLAADRLTDSLATDGDEFVPRRQLVGFGGNHYVPRFERIIRETPWTVGHVAADWALEEIDDFEAHRGVIERAFEASGAHLAVIDGEWPGLETVIESSGYTVVSETWLREVGDRPLSVVEAVERRLGAVDDGVRFGTDGGDSFEIVSLPTGLLEHAEGVDPDAVWDILESHTIAFETRNGASRVGGRVAVPAKPTRTAIVEAVASVLEDAYDRVEVREACVFLERVAFDPALAREAGVPEGPQFGALARGESVSVDGKIISPESVRRKKQLTFEY